ncbi:MAG: hypothetical protein PHI98_10150 [Eubacteriales bacterium]|nr:hypothetical protein [Eubacteriales bacterium]
MNQTASKIVSQSKTITILATVARIILYVAAGITVVSLVGSYLNITGPVLVLFGKPVYMIDLSEGMTMEAWRVQLVEALVQIGLAQALLYLTDSLFKRIGSSTTPFTAEIVKKMKSLGVLLGLVIAIDNGYLGVVVGFVIYAFAMIFEYGGELQKQVDETL